MSDVIDYIGAGGWIVSPWQVAALVTALRSKPLVTLAGISGTGKSQLPRLLAEASNSSFASQPINPAWTDSSELLGYEAISGEFVPGPLLQFARAGMDQADSAHFLLLDELNLARPEYYLAELLSVMETRRRVNGLVQTHPLIAHAGVDRSGFDWSGVSLPPNLFLIGAVNMDETTFAFSRKVLDRTFVLEFADVDLAAIGTLKDAIPQTWPAEFMHPPYLSAAELASRGLPPVAKEAIDALGEVNDYLTPLQLQVGYRVRDELAIFVANAEELRSLFVTSEGEAIDPLDLGLFAKLLPRIQGSSASLANTIEALRSWAEGGNVLQRPFTLCMNRLELMEERLSAEGFTSYWI